MADNWKTRQSGNLLEIVLGKIVQKAGHGECLTIAELDIRFAAPCRESRNAESGKRHAVRKIKRTHLRPHMEPNRVTRHSWSEIQADAVFLELHADGVAISLNRWDRDFATGE